MDPNRAFTDPDAVGRYAETTPLRVPGFADLQRMAMLLLAERAGSDASILVLGAGGGLELRAFAEAQVGWRFVGVDPSAEMLDLAKRLLGPLADRVDLQQGYIDDAPSGPFDGATCLLTLHFIEPQERLRTLRELRKRLKPGAPLVVAHHSAAAGDEAAHWLTLSVAFSDRSGIDFARASQSAAAMIDDLPVMTAEQDERLIVQAGFSDVRLFYAALSFRGWVGLA